MADLLFTFLLLATVIIIASMFLARFADRLAEQTGLGGSVTGLVLLAGATSLPELSIGFNAVKMNAADLTAGDVLGSSLVNLLILAILDLFSRTPGRILTRTAAAHAMSAIVAVILTAIVLLGMLLDSEWSLLRLGPSSWCIIGTYCVCARLLYLDQKTSAMVDQDQQPTDGHVKGSLLSNSLCFAVAGAVIFIVAPRLAHTSDTLAELTGLGQTFFGTLFVATVTSLPEAISTLTAIRLGTTDMAIGNILGSNAFNMVILAVLDIASPHPVLAIVSDTHTITAAFVIITTGAALLCMLYRAEKRWWVIEPDAMLVALLVIIALFLVYLRG
jgi:cation:H+ antiporter